MNVEKIKVMIFIKNKILNTPINVLNINNSVMKYEDAISCFKKYKQTKKCDDYDLHSLFSFFMEGNNHIIMYHSKHKNNNLIMCKYENKYYYFKIPYMDVNEKTAKLKNTNFVALYV